MVWISSVRCSQYEASPIGRLRVGENVSAGVCGAALLLRGAEPEPVSRGIAHPPGGTSVRETNGGSTATRGGRASNLGRGRSLGDKWKWAALARVESGEPDHASA